MKFIPPLVIPVTLALLSIVSIQDAQGQFYNLNTSSFAIDQGSTAGGVTQTPEGLVFDGFISVGDTVSGTFYQIRNWSSFGSTALPLRVSISGTNPLLSFLVTLYDENFGVINTYTGNTAGISEGPTTVLLPIVAAGAGDLTSVRGFQISWEDGGATSITLHNVGSSELASEWSYSVNSSNEATITGYTGSFSDLAIPESLDGFVVRGIGSRAFESSAYLISVVIPDTVESIEEKAFYNCQLLTQVTLGRNVRSIGNEAFFDCPISSIELPEGLTHIGNLAFLGGRFGAITLPAGLVSIGAQPFNQCWNLTNIQVHPLNTSFQSIDGVLFDKAGITLLQYPIGKTNPWYLVPNGVQIIEEEAFAYAPYLHGIFIPDTVRELRTAAFAACDNLTNMVFGRGVQYLGDALVQRSENLQTILFLGNAPAVVESSVFSFFDGNSLQLAYLEGTSGWGETLAGKPISAFDPSGHLMAITFAIAQVQDTASYYGLYSKADYDANRLDGRNEILSDPAGFGLFTQAQYESNRLAGQSDVLEEPASYGLYDDQSIMDLRMNGIMIRKQGETATVVFQPQSTADLANQPFTNNGTAITNEILMPGGKGFLRIQAKPE